MSIKNKEIKEIEKKVEKLQKDLKSTMTLLDKVKKVQITDKKVDKTPKNGNFTLIEVPTKIKKLLNIKDDVKRSRMEITHLLYEYIDKKKLKNPKDNKQINPNDQLKKAFEMKKNEKLTFENFQKFLDRVYSSSDSSDDESEESSDDTESSSSDTSDED